GQAGPKQLSSCGCKDERHSHRCQSLTSAAKVFPKPWLITCPDHVVAAKCRSTLCGRSCSVCQSRRPMLAKLNTFALVGIEAVPVEAEVDVSAGLPKTVLVGTNR